MDRGDDRAPGADGTRLPGAHLRADGVPRRGDAGVGFLLGGAIVAAFSPRVAYAVAGAGLILVVIAALPLPLRLAGGRARGPARPDGNNPAAGFPLPDPVVGQPEATAGHRER